VRLTRRNKGGERQLPADAVYFVDAKIGDDSQPGSKKLPWKTITASLAKLKPGDTLCLRGGTYLRERECHRVRHGGEAAHDSRVSR
jgi:hypothetical protein